MDNKPTVKQGTIVTILFDPKDSRITPGMQTYNGIKTQVTRTYNGQFECKDVNSKFGVPYIFTRDMLLTEQERYEARRRNAYYG